MQGTDHVNWMLSAALGTLARAEGMHQHFLKLLPREGLREPCWEPPVDVLETETEILILVALPGVAPDDVEAVIEGDALVVRSRRALPAELRDARIHRLELQQGCFERRIVLPPRRCGITRFSSHGCIGLRLNRSANLRGVR
jgi:HSP20 family molecular chaperone IbpA